MISMYDKLSIIKMIVEDGLSLREVSRITKRDRKTVTKYYKEYLKLNEKLENTTCKKEIRSTQNEIINQPTYPKRKVVYRKWNDEMEKFMKNQLELEHDKNIKFGINHKQKITITMMHELMIEAGFDIGLTTVRNKMNERRDKLQEVFIRQHYSPAQRCEFDYGEVLLMIKGVKTKMYLAVISLPYSNYRMAYLYNNQGQKTFLDAHNRFFKELNGVPLEMVYDNMRNVVSKFIGKSEKELNKKLIQTALYYGFEINVTNCFSGNEKGHVEKSVGFIRKKAFTIHFEFNSIEEAEARLKATLDKLNEKSSIEEEIKHLKPLKKILDISEVNELKVDKYSTVRVENNFYSVPESLVGKRIIVKNYLNDIEIYYNHNLVCEHNKKDGELEYVININHFLKTFKVKPGALKNSAALFNNKSLKSIFDKYYSTQPKKFIEIISENKNKSSDELNEILLNEYSPQVKSKVIESNIAKAATNQINQYTQMMKRRFH